MSDSALLVLTLAAGALISWLAGRLFMRPPPLDRRRRAAIDETRSALLNAEASLEDWQAEVPKLRARLARLNDAERADLAEVVRAENERHAWKQRSRPAPEIAS